MAADGHVRPVSAAGEVLHWAGRVLSAEDLRYALGGQRELIVPEHTIITPLAAEQIRANGVRVTRRPVEKPPATSARWGYAQERPHALVQSAIRALEREGLSLKELKLPDRSTAWGWVWEVADCVARVECWGGVVFCDDAGLLCCVANKVAGLRAAAVNTVAQGARATLTLGANLLAVEMPGRTFFEVRQIVRTFCSGAVPTCPIAVAGVLEELDSHARR